MTDYRSYTKDFLDYLKVDYDFKRNKGHLLSSKKLGRDDIIDFSSGASTAFLGFDKFDLVSEETSFDDVLNPLAKKVSEKLLSVLSKEMTHDYKCFFVHHYKTLMKLF